MSGSDERDECAAAWAIKLSDGDLSPADQAVFQRWLDEDPGNVDALSEIVGAWQAVDHYATADPMMELREEALADARRIRTQKPAGMAFHVPSWMLIAACVGLIFAAFAVWYVQRPELYSTGLDERRIVVLDDNSKLSLDAGTAVRVKYTRDGRQLWLERGRAKFNVARDPLRPFSVAARDKVVVATGTEFSVELLGPETRVILFEGHVAVMDETAKSRDELFREKKSVTARSDFITLDAGNELIVPAATEATSSAEKPRMLIRKPSTLGVSADWEAGQLVFDNERLAIVAERTNRYAKTPLVLASDNVADMRISGVFRAGDTEGLVEGLTATLGVTSRRSADAIVLSAPKEISTR